MAKSNDWKELNVELKTFIKWTVSGLFDSIFLILWIFTQWWTNKAIELLQLSGIDQWALLIFQVFFAISTLAPVAIYIYQDISIMLLRAQRKIQREKELNEPRDKKNV